MPRSHVSHGRLWTALLSVALGGLAACAPEVQGASPPGDPAGAEAPGPPGSTVESPNGPSEVVEGPFEGGERTLPVRSGPGRRGALDAAAAELAAHPEWLQLDAERHPPLLEAFDRRRGALHVRYRQEFEMAFGTLVAVYRGDILLAGGAPPSHRRAVGPAPADWTPLPAPVARHIWRGTR